MIAISLLRHSLTYHIALIFHGSKFLQIAVFDNFVEKNLWIHCRSRRQCEVSKFSLKYFREWHRIRENHENLDLQNISTIILLWYLHMQMEIYCSYWCVEWCIPFQGRRRTSFWWCLVEAPSLPPTQPAPVYPPGVWQCSQMPAKWEQEMTSVKNMASLRMKCTHIHWYTYSNIAAISLLQIEITVIQTCKQTHWNTSTWSILSNNALSCSILVCTMETFSEVLLTFWCIQESCCWNSSTRNTTCSMRSSNCRFYRKEKKKRKKTFYNIITMYLRVFHRRYADKYWRNSPLQ